MMEGYCRGHEERIAEIARDARKRKIGARFPQAEFRRLEQAAAAYFRAHSDDEIDLTGTMRASLSISEEARMKDAYVAALEDVSGHRAPPSASDPSAADSELNALYSRLMGCSPYGGLSGAPTAAGLSQTQQVWVGYRDAWVEFGIKVQSATPRARWRAWITSQRTETLRGVPMECP